MKDYGPGAGILKTSSPRAASNDKLAKQWISNLDPNASGPYPRPGPVTTPVGGFSSAAQGGNMIDNRESRGQARQAEIARKAPGAGPGYKPSAPPGDWD
jgi:hypothetical protein